MAEEPVINLPFWTDTTGHQIRICDPEFYDRLKQYQSMPGLTAWDKIADDWRAGKFSEEDARGYADILFPPVTETP